MASLNLDSFAAMLKNYYTNDKVQNLAYKDNPFLAMVKKDESFTGDVHPVPIQVEDSQARSTDFATGQANKGPGTLKKFILTRVRDYGFASIDNETLQASKSNSGAFLSAVTTGIDSAMNNLTRSLATALYLDGSGKIGTVASVSGSTVTLTNPDDSAAFGVNQVLQVVAVGATSVRAGVTMKIQKLDRDAGVITFTAAVSGSVVATDGLLNAGDLNAKIAGLAAWIPTVAPTTGDSFFSVDRSIDALRLGGIRVVGTGLPIDQALTKAANKAGRHGAKVDTCLISFSQYQNLQNVLGAKIQRISQKQGELDFEGIMINGARGAIKVFPDLNCPNDKAYLIQLNTWKLYSLNGAPHIIDSDSNKMLRETSSDGVEIRMAYYAQLGCSAPGFNAVVTLTP